MLLLAWQRITPLTGTDIRNASYRLRAVTQELSLPIQRPPRFKAFLFGNLFIPLLQGLVNTGSKRKFFDWMNDYQLLNKDCSMVLVYFTAYNCTNFRYQIKVIQVKEKRFKLWSCSLCMFLQPPVTSYFLGKTFLSPCSQTVNHCSPLYTRNRVVYSRFVYNAMSRPTLGPTQPPVNGYRGSFPRG
jgi:hypothetical protein